MYVYVWYVRIPYICILPYLCMMQYFRMSKDIAKLAMFESQKEVMIVWLTYEIRRKKERKAKVYT